MQYSLGIDAGGTYTDAVIIRNSDKKVVASNKALTTYPELLTGIKNVIDGLDPQYLKDIKLVSVSTTLATNTILEKTGYPVGLILVGNYLIPQDTSVQEYVTVKGGHNATGAEEAALDMEAVSEFVNRVKDNVSAFAVSSYFSVRNPEHELQVKDYIVKATGMPVICGHELSQDLGAYDRGITAYLNAQLIPIARQFIDAIVSDIERRGINAKLMMLKCDGSLINIKEAIQRPIESIFTGPAASLIGASFLAERDTCAVIDVGGTSSDVSLLHKGLPKLCEDGAKVGGWNTKVKAIRMETSAMGGDSHVWIKSRKVNIGPRRVIPLCVAAVKYPGFKETLKMGRTPARVELGENVQPTKFFVRTRTESTKLSPYEQEILSTIDQEPVSISDIYWRLGRPVSVEHLDYLIQKRLIQAIGFTPTDALHILGEYNEWDKEASFIGATIMSRLVQMNEQELAEHIKKEVAYNMALNLMSYILEGVEGKEIEKILRGGSFSKFKLSVPVVLLGGPVRAYVEQMQSIIDAEIILPPFAEVGNAVGALVGQGVKRIQILIKAVYRERQRFFLVFTPEGFEEFSTHGEALEYAEHIGENLVMDYMREADMDWNDVRIDMSREDITLHEGSPIPIETKLVFMGVGSLKVGKRS
ncbi:hydantoinase/oxoprolinase N-terminal domain-containing protein [Methanomethylovorans sp.]|uniref:hydantoinase/oxoprolinase N-terminal domain-containing protein n=1 Tax=Methanomethylovorans sp. TaxID=2758717 RepID=UPI000A726E4E|nr:hydantoinase/oxoprolinase family protein [Methanomethylovorans sp.]